MLQECHKKYWESDREDFIESVKKLLRRKKKESDQRHDSAIYIHMLFRLISADTAKELREAIAEMKVFAEAIESGAGEIERFYELEDWGNYTTKVHALKSSARVIGAVELSEKARRLEDAGNNGYWEEIKAGTAPLLELYRSFLTGLSPLLPQEEDESGKPPLSEEELAEAWQALSEVVVSFDYDSLNYMLAELSSYRLPREEAGRLKEIKEAARLPDWEKLKEILG